MASEAYSPGRKSLTLNLIWLLTAGLFLITVENLWLDRWIRSRIPDFPSLVPEPPGIPWLLTFAAIGIACAVLLVGQILLMRREGVSRNAKIFAAITVLAALSLSVIWFCVTSGLTSPPRFFSFKASHTVTLRWQTSTTAGVGYNIYPVAVSTGKEEKLNDQPLHELTFLDKHVVNGEKYIYYATAVIGKNESPRSLPAHATVPPS